MSNDLTIDKLEKARSLLGLDDKNRAYGVIFGPETEHAIRSNFQEISCLDNADDAVSWISFGLLYRVVLDLPHGEIQQLTRKAWNERFQDKVKA